MTVLDSFSVFFLMASAGEQDFLSWLVSTNVFNIVMMALVLGFLIKKFNLLNVFDERRETVRKEVEALEAKRDEAFAELETIKQKTQNLSDEVEAVLKQAESAASGLSQQILDDARLEAEKIVEASKKRMEMEQRTAVALLEKRLLAEAIQDAQSELAALSDDDKHRSVDSFIDALPQLKD